MNLYNSIGYYVLMISILLGGVIGFLGKLYEKKHPNEKVKDMEQLDD